MQTAAPLRFSCTSRAGLHCKVGAQRSMTQSLRRVLSSMESTTFSPPCHSPHAPPPPSSSHQFKSPPLFTYYLQPAACYPNYPNYRLHHRSSPECHGAPVLFAFLLAQTSPQSPIDCPTGFGDSVDPDCLPPNRFPMHRSTGLGSGLLSSLLNRYYVKGAVRLLARFSTSVRSTSRFHYLTSTLPYRVQGGRIATIRY